MKTQKILRGLLNKFNHLPNGHEPEQTSRTEEYQQNINKIESEVSELTETLDHILKPNTTTALGKQHVDVLLKEREAAKELDRLKSWLNNQKPQTPGMTLEYYDSLSEIRATKRRMAQLRVEICRLRVELESLTLKTGTT